MLDDERNTFVIRDEELLPMLIVGLGGTGKKVVTRLKARFYEQFKKVPDTVRLMALDIDVKEDPYMLGEQEISLLPDEEMMDLGDVPAGDIIQEIKRNRYPEVRDWFNPNVPLQEANLRRGGQQNRQLGRLALFWNIRARNLYRALESTVHYLKQQGLVNKAGNVSRERSTDLVIYMVGSLAGGTGSGIMIDTAYLLRRIANSIGILDSTSVVGIFVMPRPFDRVRQEAIQPNTLAALQELDYFMSCPVEARRFDSIRYIEGSPVNKVDCTERPFNVCYLIDAVGSKGERLPSIEQLLPMIVDSMFLLSVSRMGTMAWSNINNLSRKFVGTRVFSSFGVASLVFPASQIQHICAAKVGAEVISQVLNQPSAEAENELARELDRFIAQLSLTYNDLMTRLRMAADGRQISLNLLVDERLMAARLDALPKDQWYVAVTRVVDDLISTWEAAARKRIEENRENVLQLLAQDVEVSLKRKVRDLINNPTYGLNYTVSYLERLGARLRSLETEVERQCSLADTRKGTAKKQRTQSAAHFDQEVIQSARFLSRANPKAARDAYLRDSNNLLNYTLSLDAHTNAKKLLAEFAEQVSLLLGQLNRLAGNLIYVRDTYLPGKEKTYRDEIKEMDTVRHKPIIRPQDIDALYEKYKENASHWVLQSILAGNVLQGGEGLYGLMLAQGEEIGAKLYQFALQSVEEVLGIGLENVVQERERDREHPVDKLQWLRELHANADVFWKYTEAGTASGDGDIATQFMVTGVEDAQQSIYQLAGTQEQSLCSTGDPHRITVLQMKHALDYRYTKQYSEFRDNYRKAILRGYPLHIFPEFSVVGGREKNVFIQGLVYGFITRRGPIFYCIGVDGNPAQLNKTGQDLRDVLWNFARERRGKLVELVESEIEKKLYGPTVTDDERRTLFEAAREKVGNLNLVKKEADTDSQLLATELGDALEAHLKPIAKELGISY